MPIIAPPGTDSSSEALSFMDGGTGAAFADIVFLLLAFLVTVFSLKAALDLPDTDARHQSASAEVVSLNVVQRDGAYYLQAREKLYAMSDEGALVTAIRELTRAGSSPVLEVGAEASVPFAIVRSVMSAAQDAGFESLSIVTRRKSP